MILSMTIGDRLRDSKGGGRKYATLVLRVWVGASATLRVEDGSEGLHLTE